MVEKVSCTKKPMAAEIAGRAGGQDVFDTLVKAVLLLLFQDVPAAGGRSSGAAGRIGGQASCRGLRTTCSPLLKPAALSIHNNGELQRFGGPVVTGQRSAGRVCATVPQEALGGHGVLALQMDNAPSWIPVEETQKFLARISPQCSRTTVGLRSMLVVEGGEGAAPALPPPTGGLAVVASDGHSGHLAPPPPPPPPKAEN